MRKKREIKKIISRADKKSLTTYIVIRFLIIVCFVMQIIHKEWNNAFLCLLTLILITLPFAIEDKFKIDKLLQL